MRSEYDFSKGRRDSANYLSYTGGMTRVYRNMALSVLNTMVVAYFISKSPELMTLLYTGAAKWVILFAPLVAIFVVCGIISNTSSASLAHFLLHLFAFLMGLSMGAVIATASASNIISAFLGATVLFSTMALYGTITKRNLEGWGQFLIIGLIAIIIAAIINIFIGSTVAELVISSIGIIIFLGLTAYDVQQIKESIKYGNTSAEVFGALSLYLNFMNIFLDLLRILSAFEE